MKENKIRYFGISDFAISNKTTIYLLSIMLFFFGLLAYLKLPKELFPDVEIPKILVQTIYPGNSPEDMESLITKELEKELKGCKGYKKMTSKSQQDLSVIVVEFVSTVSIKEAKDEVKDKVDYAVRKLPKDLPAPPTVIDIDLTEIPIINLNLSGEYSLEELKKFSEDLQDEIELLPEIRRVDIRGAEEKQVHINCDLLKMESYQVSFADIEKAFIGEHISMSAGTVRQEGISRNVRIVGEFRNVKDMRNIVVRHNNQGTVYLRDVATIEETFGDEKNRTRLEDTEEIIIAAQGGLPKFTRHPVLSLQVVKRSGENMLNAIDKIFAIINKAKSTNMVPANLTIVATNDMSENIRTQLSNLENSIVISMLFVFLILFYFLGTRNALLVGLAIPTSMFMSFLILNLMGEKINMIVLFSLILALGMLVDNAIVVVENYYRYLSTTNLSKTETMRRAVGEIALPVIASTATTLAAFFPLIFWEGIMGQFMKLLPITLIIVLSSSLFVALVLLPVFGEKWVQRLEEEKPINSKKQKKIGLIFFILAAILFFICFKTKAFSYTLPNLLLIGSFVMFGYAIIFTKMQHRFQNTFLPWLENSYAKLIAFTLRKKNPLYAILSTIVLLFVTFIFFGQRNLNIVFFPKGDPKYINIYIDLPVGTNLMQTDSVMRQLEKEVDSILGSDRRIVRSQLVSVGKVGKPGEFIAGDTENRGMITITFLDYNLRNQISTSQIKQRFESELIGKYPGVDIQIDQDENGPSTGKAVSIEVSGPDFHKLLLVTDEMRSFIISQKIDGIESLQLDLDMGSPELLIQVDREKAGMLNLSTSSIAVQLRTSLYGKHISDYKVNEDSYDIMLRTNDMYRDNLAALLDQSIIIQKDGVPVRIPLSSIASFTYNSTYNAINRKNNTRVIKLESNVKEGYNANLINDQIMKALRTFHMPANYKFTFGGEQEEQEESKGFLVLALIIALCLITFILVAQLNSLMKPFIIMTSVLFSTIGVFGGLALFKMDFVIVMTGIGIISLAGIVVNNAIVLIDYLGVLLQNRANELDLSDTKSVSIQDFVNCMEEAGKTRLRPVLLTAITTLLGLFPMAIGLNIDIFEGLANFDPDIYFGGDNAQMWSNLSWTIIFGLAFSTILTLIIVPAMLVLTEKLRRRFTKTTKSELKN